MQLKCKIHTSLLQLTVHSVSFNTCLIHIKSNMSQSKSRQKNTCMCGENTDSKLTQRPDKIVLWPQSQHGQVKVDDLEIEGRGADEVVIYGVVHWEQLIQRQIDAQRDGTRAQLGDDIILGRGEGRECNARRHTHTKRKQSNNKKNLIKHHKT